MVAHGCLLDAPLRRRNDRGAVTSERIQRQIERLLDEADKAFTVRDWAALLDSANDVLSLDSENSEARTYLAAAERNLGGAKAAASPSTEQAEAQGSSSPPQLTSFVNGRYQVQRFLGEGGKKKVYLAHDTLLDRDVAFALIKTEGLDEVARSRITREAQAMGRLGDHPHIMPIYDLGQEQGQPYMVLPLMSGGDVEGRIEKAPDHRMSLEQA